MLYLLRNNSLSVDLVWLFYHVDGDLKDILAFKTLSKLLMPKNLKDDYIYTEYQVRISYIVMLLVFYGTGVRFGKWRS